MKHLLWGFLLLTAGYTCNALANPAYTQGVVNLRAGPSAQYPLVLAIPPDSRLDVFGCLDDFTWCDVDWEGNRGWLYANYLYYDYQDRRVPVLEFGAALGIGVLAFSIGDYWGSYYAHRPWYRQRDYWYHRPPLPRRPPPRLSRPGWQGGRPGFDHGGRPGGPPPGVSPGRPGGGGPPHGGGRPGVGPNPGAGGPGRPGGGAARPQPVRPQPVRPQPQPTRPPTTRPSLPNQGGPGRPGRPGGPGGAGAGTRPGSGAGSGGGARPAPNRQQGGQHDDVAALSDCHHAAIGLQTKAFAGAVVSPQRSA